MQRFTFTLLVPLLFSVCQAQAADAAAQKGIDAHALKFSGRHCAGNFQVKSEGKGSAASFKLNIRAMNAAAKAATDEVAKTQPAAHYQSSFNDKDLFRAVASGPKGARFMMMYWKAGQAYFYACDLR
ncbi:hypothetical protein [Deinococcus hopiensis]|uniref:Uncharacterized protein n=1 Tax=Deinococcus hopiensis KR-140 TaxID=695939 RepID=A0A1W1UZ01_9DEIO|nr:hypothetical protein [Deinococcus hopiensis]SMB86352.1 hypothetical protein SAMN00790413_03782 [Deinococcus hopiensis KR-140]